MSVQVQAPLRYDAPKRAHRSRVSKAAAKRKRTTPPASQHKMVNGLYVHSNPPRVLNMNPSVIRQWLRGGELDKLQQVVLEGQGHKLVGEYSPDPKVRAFLKTVPAIMANVEMLHDLVSKGQLAGMQQVLEKDLQATKRKSLALCKDQSGVGLLHKAVYHDHQDIVHFLGAFNPSTVDVKDKEGRTALHYAGHCKAPEDCWALLTAAGADQNVADCKGNVAAHYLDHPEQAVLSECRQFSGAMKRFTSGKGGFVVTKANIRIWIHDRDLGRLQQMLWEGHGNKLRVETSNNPRVKRFLDAVPYIMGVIRDAHASAVANDVAAFKKKTADPVPAAILCSKDQNGLNPLHKAAGLGHTELVEYILERNPKAANMADNDGKLPLHYAAAVKDEGHTYNLLAEATADDRALDNRGKFPGYYRLKPGEVDAAGRLRAVPDAPRTASTFPPAWDWRLLNNMTYDFGPISGHDDSLRDDSGHEAGNSTSEDSEHSKLQDLGDAEHGEIKLGPENEVNLTIDEDEGVGREIEEQEEGEEAERGEAGDQDTAAEGTEDAEAAAEEAEAAAVYQEMEAEEEGIEETATDDADHQETAAEGAENEEITAEDAEKEGTAADETENEETEAEGGGANGGEQLAVEETTEEAADDGDAVQDAETGEREIKETEGTDANAELAGGQVERWERGETEDGEEVAKSPDGEGTTEDQDEASKDEEPGARAEGAVENDAPEEQVDGNINMDHGNSNEEEGGGEVKTESKDAEIRRLIDSGNMEALAAMILNGEGYRLVGRASSDPELQGFLNNIPVYMNKIAAVHEAAREGRLRDLQAALDRRKFAVARDGSRGSLGATPVHVATLFGHTSVLRYLAGRFPETLNARDALGRTPLHYAAVVQDNQHYYNMLVGLGADTGSQDDMGNTPEYYQQNPDVLTHQQLLKDYGASMNTADILADKDDSTDNSSDSTTRTEIPVIWTEEGRYLASTLGQPLMKGLTEVATNRPRDPIAYLAAYLYNYANRNKSRVGTQESHVLLTSEPAEAENTEEPPETQDILEMSDDAPPSPDIPESAFAVAERDEHGQSMLHFAAARTHGRNALFQLLDEAQMNLGYRDALHRTARDVAVQAGLPENVRDVDRWVLFLAARGETEKLLELMLEGYDHILDVTDEDKNSVLDVVASRSLHDTQAFLQSVAPFEERREQLHAAVRGGDVERARQIMMPEDGGKASLLAVGKSAYSRTCLHVAVLCQDEQLVHFLAAEFPLALWIGDNLERTPLHYAMGLEKFESLSTILIKAGAVRVAKDLKGRQPTYYFMNKSDIVELQEEEEAMKYSETL